MTLTSEEENLVHTLKDIRTTQDVVKYNTKRIKEIQDRLEPRIKSLEERLNGIISQKMEEDNDKK